MLVDQKAYALAMRVFDVSKCFPADERYSLTDQIGKMLGGMIKQPEKFFLK